MNPLAPLRDKVPALTFVLGLALPLAVLLAGPACPDLYNRQVVPFLHQYVLAWLPLVAAAAVLFGLFQAESLGHYPKAMFALGVAVSLPLVNDWWYFAPCSYVALTGVGVWQVRVQFWSRHRWAGVIAGSLIAVMLGRAALGQGGVPGFDARFGVGIPVRWEGWLRAAMVIGPFALLAYWVLRCFRRGGRASRAPLAALLDLDPRCEAYFELTSLVTRVELAPGDGSEAGVARLPSCVRPRRAESPSKTSFPNDRPVRWDRFCARQVLGLLRYRKWVGLLRYLRPPAREPGHSSVFVRAMLREGAQNEANLARQVLFGEEAGTLFDYLVALPPEEELRTQGEADDHFSRHVHFREALLDADHLLFLRIPVVGPEDWTARAKEASARLLPRAPAPPARTGEPDPIGLRLQEASRATLALWLDVLDWLFFERGDEMVRTGKSARSAVDLAQLTCNLLSLRLAARARGGAEDSRDAAAADLALWLFVGAQTDPAAAAACVPTLRAYFAAIGVARAMPPAQRTEAVLAGAAYAVYCLSRGEVREAPRWFVADRGNLAEGAPEIAWLDRVGAFAKAGSALGSFRANPLGAEEQCRWTIGAFESIDGARLPAETAAATWPEGLRSLHFVLHLQRAHASAARPRR